MSTSLRDQLLGLGFKPAAKAPKASEPPRARHPKPRPPATGKPKAAKSRPAQSQEEIDLAKAYAIRAQREKHERIEAEREKQDAARQRREAQTRLSTFLDGKARSISKMRILPAILSTAARSSAFT